MIAGLKPYPAMKDSGVPWLGRVPEHWELTRLKRVVTLNPSRTEARRILEPDTAVTFLPMERVGADGQIGVDGTVAASAVWSGYAYFRRGDVLVAKITPCFENGKGACLNLLATEFGFGSTEFHVLRASPSVLRHFLYRLTTGAAFRELGADAMDGAAGQQRVPRRFIADYPVALPPIQEQAAIVP
jgi:type I restriction enzyme S subunit